tara:strand:+ start:13677 stop:13958 length:282 start_codon:yes stop_codon:yes gene_type:complete
MAFKIGQKVVCVEKLEFYQLEFDLGVRYPVVGEIYTIRNFYKGYLRFVEIVNPKINYIEGFNEVAFIPDKFRPLDYEFVEEVIKQVKPQKQKV